MKNKLEAFFFVTLVGAEFQVKSRKGLRINDTMYITNNFDVIGKYIHEKKLEGKIGSLEYDHLKVQSSFVYSKYYVDQSIVHDAGERQQQLLRLLYEVQSFFSTAWLFMDGGVILDDGYLVVSIGDSNILDKNHLRNNIYSSDLLNRVVTLEESLLKEIRDLNRVVTKVDMELQASTVKLSKNKSRLSLCLYHIQIARSHNDWMLRVAFFVCALESLFNTSKAEISHQISQITISFLDRTVEDKLEVYELLKQCYSIRSYVFHGAVIKDKKLKNIGELSRFIENIVKEVVVVVFQNFSLYELFQGDEQALRNTLLRRIL
ncbi:hypothetical protein BALOs_2217 [Halobacteriovorax sp. BALOs_7]|uniref:HEPN domain-containing protein n=1 Tax=Halobacteriovorax sp. BALOs_7 TaxID=2109558 RepID=UPI000EA17383|nr:HEPN domain-containing protein [Halobacteriovorax sp. BALOs_7]AYF45215.1 hypothetical protein BALOs_2217 [Halobacteriovorax sp. BALOs_7]